MTNWRALSAVVTCWFVGAALGLLPAPSRAALLNGDFETGDTAGWNVYWSTAGTGAPQAYAAVVGPSVLLPPLSGNYSASLATVSYFPVGMFGTVTCATDLFNPNYCPPYPPGGLPTAAAVGGPAVTHALPPGLILTDYGMAYLAQDFMGSAGHQLEWDWLRDLRADSPDYMFYALTNGTHFKLYQSRGGSATYFEGIMAGSSVMWLEQDFSAPWIMEGVLQHETVSLPGDGLWSLYLGVVQTADAWQSAAIQIDNVQLTGTVAEPSSLALAAIGVMVLASVRRRSGD